MPHLQFEINFSVSQAEKVAFAASVKDRFAQIMDTGTDHTAVTIRCYDADDLSFGTANDAGEAIAFVNADIRAGRTAEQKRELSVALIEDLFQLWKVPRSNVYVVLTEHAGNEFHLHDRVLPTWSEGDDPLGA